MSIIGTKVWFKDESNKNERGNIIDKIKISNGGINIDAYLIQLEDKQVKTVICSRVFQIY